MSTDYIDSEVVAFVQDIEPLLGDLGRLAVNTARMEHDANVGPDNTKQPMGYAASRAKHLQELRDEVGVPVPTLDFTPAPRFWQGNMCGVRVPGLPRISGGAMNSQLVLSWFYDRYNDADRAKIRDAWRARGYTHVLLSWPDSRVYGRSPEQFRDTCRELVTDGFFPCPMLCSKDHDPHDVSGVMENVNQVLPLLVGVVPLVCIGWELSLWLSPTDVQSLIDQVAPQFAPLTRVYVHFQEGYMGFQQPGHFIADFWKANVGKLTGVLAQKKLSQDNAQFRDWINDCLLRVAGNFNMPAESGFGHPFDFVMLEVSAQPQFNNGMLEHDGDVLGQFAIDSPEVTGPAGTVRVQGSGNGSL
jgi:hypothetical protein